MRARVPEKCQQSVAQAFRLFFAEVAVANAKLDLAQHASSPVRMVRNHEQRRAAQFFFLGAGKPDRILAAEWRPIHLIERDQSGFLDARLGRA